MKAFLYPGLAAVNIRKNARFYLPFMISAAVSSAMFYVLCSVATNSGIQKAPGSAYLSEMLYLGCIVIAIFSFVFLLYTNSFIAKRRMTEFGLYSVLGMEKRQISLVLFFETLYVYLISTVGGILTGMLFDRLITMLLCRLLRFDVAFTFRISAVGITAAVILFAAVFSVCMISNVIRIGRSDITALLASRKTGEREPKTKWPITVIGVLTLAGGYAISISVKTPLSALLLFFVAVMLVIIGTYCLFTSGSIAVLRLMRKNKNYYYKPAHFCSISGMIYRMKRNAAGLASICILSTMVLVTVSTTVSLYAGTEDAINKRYPAEINVFQRYDATGFPNTEAVISAASDAAGKDGFTVSDPTCCVYCDAAVIIENGRVVKAASSTDGNARILCVMPLESYTSLTGEAPDLKGGVAVCYPSQQSDNTFGVGDLNYDITLRLTSFPAISNFSSYIIETLYIVMPSREAFTDVCKTMSKIVDSASNGTVLPALELYFNVSGSGDIEELTKNLSVSDALSGDRCMYTAVSSRTVYGKELYAMYGSFLFIGIVLGTLFLLVTVMIIYYKQISEGYEDKDRFEIMQKVGMSRAEIRSTVGSQILTVFLLPLLAAFCHLAFAFPMIRKLLALLQLTNVGVFIAGLAVTAALFAGIYVIVYFMTSRAYYRIVS